MWRFMLVTFGFLGLVFFEMSGGADYAPVDNSIQVRALQEPATPATRPKTKPSRLASVEDLRTTRLEQLDTTPGGRFEVTLASANTTSFRTETARPSPAADEKLARLTAPEAGNPVEQAVARALTDPSVTAQTNATKIWPGAIELFSQRQARQAVVPTGSDIRYVTGNVVNMRNGPGTGHARITSLTQGTEVAVLDSTQDGWLMLRVTDTGEEGWMADWLVSAPAN